MIPTGGLYVEAALWSQVASAVLFIGVLVWLWNKYLQPAILAAQERQNEQIALAERHRDEAKGTLELLRGEIEGATRDAALIAERAAVQAERESAAVLGQAREAGERALADAAAEYARALAAARERLRDEMLAQALERARSQAARIVDATVDGRIVERFISTLAVPPSRSGETARG